MNENERRARQRQHVETEVEDDLRKPYRQLLLDIHDELLNPDPGTGTDIVRDVERIKHSLKRISSLFAKLGIDSQKTQKRLLCLNWLLAFLTVAVIAIGVLQLR